MLSNIAAICLLVFFQGIVGQNNDTQPAQNTTSPPSPALQLFKQIHNHQIAGITACQSPADCALGFKCEMLLGLCVPLTTPIIFDQEAQKTCNASTECSDLYGCVQGACRFCGPKLCQTNDECCVGIPGHSYQCTTLPVTPREKLIAELGKGQKKKDNKDKRSAEKDGQGSEESEEKKVGKKMRKNKADPLGFHSQKRCWAECIQDADCQCPRLSQQLGTTLACCSGICIPRDSCYGPGISPQSTLGILQQSPLSLAVPPAQIQANATTSTQASTTTSQATSTTQQTTSASSTASTGLILETTTTTAQTTTIDFFADEAETSPAATTTQTSTGPTTTTTESTTAF